MTCDFDLQGMNQAEFLKTTINKYNGRLVRSVILQISTLNLTSSMRTVWFSVWNMQSLIRITEEKQRIRDVEYSKDGYWSSI